MFWPRMLHNYTKEYFIAVTIDLVDLDGQITNLSGRTREYANELVTGRGTYILIRVESE